MPSDIGGSEYSPLSAVSRGFSLVEVIVGLIVTMAFVLGIYPLLALSAINVSRSIRQSSAIGLVQEDLDAIKVLATQFDGAPDVNGNCTVARPFANTFAGIGGSNLPLPSNRGNLTIQRTISLATPAPAPDVLTVTYQVVDTNGQTVLDELTSEIVPSAVFTCPPPPL